MKTQGHKSGICFYGCFYFRCSVWKKTFLYIPGYLCEDREIMINTKVKKKKGGEGEESFLDPGERILVHGRLPQGPSSLN